MIRTQLQDRNLTDPRVLGAFAAVDRAKFVPKHLKHLSYADRPLEIGQGQTISQPYIVALMVCKLELKPDDHVLDVGTGSGYAAAILANLVTRVVSIERIPKLAQSAEKRLQREGFKNIHVVCGDGTEGYPPEAPYDAIVVAAASPEVPEPLKQQLRLGGRLVIPVGSHAKQTLLRIIKVGTNEFHEEDLGAVRFVPLVGEKGWN